MNKAILSSTVLVTGAGVSTIDPRLSRVKSAETHPDRFDALIANLATSVDGRDLFAILETLRTMVPEYEPGETFLRSLEGAST